MKKRHWTVGEAAKATGVSIRTLHHYDDIGLLTPSERTESGYRLYGRADMRRLRSIFLYRQLGFSLEAIGILLDSSAFDRRKTLEAQRALLEDRLAETNQQIRVLDEELEHEKKVEVREMSTNAHHRQDFWDSDSGEFADEAKVRWGETPAYKESMRRIKRYTKDDWSAMKAERDDVEQRLAELFAAGVAPDDEAAMEAAEAHRLQISRWFYPCDHRMHIGLADLYLADHRFTEYYERRAEGLASFVAAAIKANAKRAVG